MGSLSMPERASLYLSPSPQLFLQSTINSKVRRGSADAATVVVASPIRSARRAVPMRLDFIPFFFPTPSRRQGQGGRPAPDSPRDNSECEICIFPLVILAWYRICAADLPQHRIASAVSSGRSLTSSLYKMKVVQLRAAALATSCQQWCQQMIIKNVLVSLFPSLMKEETFVEA